MEEVDDDDENLGTYPCNVAPLNRSHILELSNGSNDEDGPIFHSMMLKSVELGSPPYYQ